MQCALCLKLTAPIPPHDTFPHDTFTWHIPDDTFTWQTLSRRNIHMTPLMKPSQMTHTNDTPYTWHHYMKPSPRLYIYMTQSRMTPSNEPNRWHLHMTSGVSASGWARRTRIFFNHSYRGSDSRTKFPITPSSNARAANTSRI